MWEKFVLIQKEDVEDQRVSLAGIRYNLFFKSITTTDDTQKKNHLSIDLTAELWASVEPKLVCHTCPYLNTQKGLQLLPNPELDQPAKRCESGHLLASFEISRKMGKHWSRLRIWQLMKVTRGSTTVRSIPHRVVVHGDESGPLTHDCQPNHWLVKAYLYCFLTAPRT